MKRFCVVLLLPFLLANACETRRLAPKPEWEANDVDRARLGRLAADPWLRPERSTPGGTNPGGRFPELLRPSTKRWSEDPIPGDPYDALAAEIGAARQAGWFITGVYCSNHVGIYGDGSERSSGAPDLDSVYSVDLIVVGFAKSVADLDHAAAAYLLEGLRRERDASSSNYAPKGTIVVAGVAPHHADRGWPKYVPVQLTDTCIADPHRPRLPTEKESVPKTNPPPPEEESFNGPLDQAGTPFAKWDRSARFSLSSLQASVSSTPTAPSS